MNAWQVMTRDGVRALSPNDLTAAPVSKRADRGGVPMVDGARTYRDFKKRFREDRGSAIEVMLAKAIEDARALPRAERVVVSEAAQPPTSAAELRALYDREARALEPNDSLERARAKFAQLARGEQLSREILAVAEAERRRVTKAMPAIDYGSAALAKIVDAAERRITKSPTRLSKAQAIDRVLHERPELYSEHLAEVRAAPDRPTQAEGEFAKVARELVAKSNGRLSYAKAYTQAMTMDREGYARHVGELRGR